MNFVCPYCNQPTTITSPNKDGDWHRIAIAAEQLSYKHRLGMRYLAIACPNKKCKRLTFTFTLTGATNEMYHSEETTKVVQKWNLLPESKAKPQPSYIPKQIIQDYTEACRINQLSPKASATLARRCLQGMIRDFHSIKKGTLNEEITALKGIIPNDEWQAIDALRSIGNIGAHMEKDVNLIVDISEGEADKLIAFIEYLFKQWYVKRQDDKENLAAVQAMAGIKKAEKQAAKKQPVKPSGSGKNTQTPK
jgi:hypothetical protein